MPVTSVDVQAEIASRNKRNRTMVPAQLLATQKPWYIHNISEFPQKAELGSLRTWHIPACPKDQDYVTKEVPGFTADEYDLGDGNGRMAWNPVMGEDLANDILNNRAGLIDLSINTVNLEWWGCFASPNQEPTEKELATARKKLDQMLTLLLADGDRLAMQGPSDKPGVGINAISSMHRYAAQFKGQARTWATEQQTLIDCPNCGDKCKPTIIQHSCGWVFDEKRYKANLKLRQPKGQEASA